MFNIFVLECIWYKVNNYEHGKEFPNFLDTILKAECFLQVRFCLFPTHFTTLKKFFYLLIYLFIGLCWVLVVACRIFSCGMRTLS